jgi:hypothetical protein
MGFLAKNLTASHSAARDIALRVEGVNMNLRFFTLAGRFFALSPRAVWKARRKGFYLPLKWLLYQ